MRTRILQLFFVSATLVGAATMPKFPTLAMSVGVHDATIVFGPPRAMPSVTGAAFSADEVLDQTKTLPDGAHRTQSSVIGHLFRDSQGRTRVEQVWKAAPIWTTEIFDPVEGFAYILDEQHKVAHRMAIQQSQPQPVAIGQGAGLSRPTTEERATRTS